jgi:uncharacterized repeat protein (TIGR03803 family)
LGLIGIYHSFIRTAEVFELYISGGVWKGKDIYTFTGGTDGLWPVAGLYLNKDGSLYGTTRQGGTHDVGTVFKVSQTGGGWSEQVVHSFAGTERNRSVR